MDLQTILTAFTSLVTLASIIASQTETRVDDNWVGKAQKVLDICAFNFGKAKD